MIETKLVNKINVRHIVTTIDDNIDNESATTTTTSTSISATTATTTTTTTTISRIKTKNVRFRRGVYCQNQCPPLVVAPQNGDLRLVPNASLITATPQCRRQPHYGHSTPPPLPVTAHNFVARQHFSSSPMKLNQTSTDDTPSLVRRPVQILADPRVYKGSVFANRRIAINNAKRAEKAENKEKKYRVGVIRDQLSSILPRVPQPTKSGNFPIQRPNLTVAKRSAQQNFLPGLAGTASIDKFDGKKSFGTARFLPVRGSSANRQKINQVQSIDEPTSIGRSTHVEASTYPVKVVVNFETSRRAVTDFDDGRGLMNRRRRNSRFVPASQTTTPPSSSRIVYPIVSSAVQTDDNFDEKFDDLVKELANSAITMAQIQIDGEERIAQLQKRADVTEHELLNMSNEQRAEQEKLRREVIEKSRQLENWKKQDAEAREAQRIALETCQEVTRKTLENLKIIEKNSKKSIGLDTREMNRFEQKMELVKNELEKDFFPWIFQRAERMFRNQIARNELDQGTLNELQHRREIAKKRLISMNTRF